MSLDSGANGNFLKQYLGKTRWEMPIMLSESSWAAHKATLAARIPFTDFEYSVVVPGAQQRWFSISGEPLFDASTTFTGYRGTGKDITERKDAEEKIRHLALHDALTGLPNRPLLQDRLHKAIADASRQGHAVWVVFVDLDRFKHVNDSLGHKAGDILLTTIAGRLQATLRENDTVARIGGDEFLLVLQDVPGQSLTTGTFKRILDAVAAPVALDGQSVVISCSIGAAAYPHDGMTAELLMERADAAMYRAKQSGRNNFQFFAAAMNEGAGEISGKNDLSHQ
jgi:diguanylate cyclase (GGDEF)-like protein